MAFELDDSPPAAPDQPGTPESAEILDNMPEPQQHAIDAAQSQATEAQSNEEGEKDDSGEVWNASIHATGSDGKGVRTAKGLWRRRKGTGAGPRTASKVYRPADGKADQAKSEAAQKLAEQTQAACRAAGGAAASSVFMIGRIFGGDKWSPTEPEVILQTDAWAAYFQAKGITEFPPSLAVCIAVAGYAGPRFFLPESKERMGSIKHWFAIRIAKRRVKKALKKRGIEASVTIKGVQSTNVYDSILIDGKPFNESEYNKPQR